MVARQTPKLASRTKSANQNSARDALDDASVESKEELSCTLGYLDALRELSGRGVSQVIALFSPSNLLVDSTPDCLRVILSLSMLFSCTALQQTRNFETIFCFWDLVTVRRVDPALTVVSWDDTDSLLC